MRTEAETAAEYFAALQPAQRDVLRPVYDVVRRAMPSGYAETVGSGPTWSVPIERYPDTYNGKPLGYVSLAAQKRHCALYLMALYSQPEAYAEFRAGWQAPSGRPLDMGKSCVRFSRVADLDLDLIADTVSATSVEDFLATYDRIRNR